MRDLEQKFKFSSPSVKNGNYRFHVSLFFLEVDRTRTRTLPPDYTHPQIQCETENVLCWYYPVSTGTGQCVLNNFHVPVTHATLNPKSDIQRHQLRVCTVRNWGHQLASSSFTSFLMQLILFSYEDAIKLLLFPDIVDSILVIDTLA